MGRGAVGSLRRHSRDNVGRGLNFIVFPGEALGACAARALARAGLATPISATFVLGDVRCAWGSRFGPAARRIFSGGALRTSYLLEPRTCWNSPSLALGGLEGLALQHRCKMRWDKMKTEHHHKQEWERL